MTADADRAAELLEGALADGDLSEDSSRALMSIGGNAGTELGFPLGSADVHGDDLLLATLLIDDSTSIGEIADGVKAVTRGHNYCLEALEEELPSEILVLTRYLNSGTKWPYQGLATAPRLSDETYQLHGATPLYRQSLLTLGAVMAKAREQRRRGHKVRAFTMIVSDGEDNHSGNIAAQHVSFLVKDMLEFSDDYIVAGMGIGSAFRFEAIFRSMGIPDNWILTAPASADEIRKLFKRIAKSLQLAASGDEGWRQLEAGPVADD